MAYNQSGLEAGLVHADNVNNPETRVIRGKNKFPQSFIHPSSCRYGEVDPVAAMKCERGDTFPYKFVTDLDTFTMKSPLKSKVNMYSAAFKVPMQAIYPRNWEIMLPTPNKGDDVPEDTRALLDPISLDNLYSEILSSLPKDNTFYPKYIRLVLLKELIFSDGSLFSKFNMHYSAYPLYRMNSDGSGGTSYQYLLNGFDEWFDTIFAPWLRDAFEASFQYPSAQNPFYHLKPIDDDDKRYYIVTDDDKLIASSSSGDTAISFISFRRALELLRTGEYDVNFGGYDFDTEVVSWPITGLRESEEVNIEPIIAYQLCCAHFFTNSKIDFVYTAQLWRDNMQSLGTFYDTSSDPGVAYSLTFPSFEYNGVYMQYDVMSKIFFILVQSSLPQSLELGDPSFFHRITSFWFNLFSFQRSLRYGDYFTGAHTEPLAVGDINAPVVNGSVNALTMTRRIQFTRYLNKVNISGPRLEDWLRAVFGGKKPEAPKDVPIKLSVETFNVSGFEVNNTGDAQQNPDDRVIATTNLRLTDSKYMFEAEIEEPCWIIAVQYFDAHRIYSRTFDRFAFHKDRYDDFIPDFQFIGDQEVFLKELDATSLGSELPYAYNLRYMEYKNRYSYASGLFVRKLRSWAFITDNSDGNPANRHIDPEYIRSSPSEFDRFYKSLSGYSLGTYAHFITFTTNVVSPYRQMVYAPEILA